MPAARPPSYCIETPSTSIALFGEEGLNEKTLLRGMPKPAEIAACHDGEQLLEGHRASGATQTSDRTQLDQDLNAMALNLVAAAITLTGTYHWKGAHTAYLHYRQSGSRHPATIAAPPLSFREPSMKSRPVGVCI